MAYTQKGMTQTFGSTTATTVTKLQDNGCTMIPANGPFGNKTVGPRTVIVMADPLEWDENTTYEYLTLVLSGGNSYISKKDVPAGTPLTDDEYWVKSSEWNAQLANLEEEIQDLIENNKFTPKRHSEYSSTMEYGTLLESNGENEVIVADPVICGAASNGSLVNPLPIINVVNTYRTAANLQYGNDYTATNVTSDYSGWDPAIQHKDASGKMNIDCTTLVILAAMGVTYSASTYSDGGVNMGFNAFINMFTDTVKEYMNYESVLISGTEIEPEHRRLLASELAKLLYDSGKLVKLNAATITAQVKPGDILFLNLSEDETKHWKGISHCSVVVDVFGGNIVVIDASENRGGVNNAVNYHYMNTNDVNHAMFKFTPPQYYYPLTVANTFSSENLLTTEQATQSFATSGYVVLTNKAEEAVSMTVSKTYPTLESAMTATITLQPDYWIAFTMPTGSSISVTCDKANVVMKVCGAINNYTPEPSYYIPTQES